MIHFGVAAASHALKSSRRIFDRSRYLVLIYMLDGLLVVVGLPVVP